MPRRTTLAARCVPARSDDGSIGTLSDLRRLENRNNWVLLDAIRVITQLGLSGRNRVRMLRCMFSCGQVHLVSRNWLTKLPASAEICVIRRFPGLGSLSRFLLTTGNHAVPRVAPTQKSQKEYALCNAQPFHEKSLCAWGLP